jgi:hypothetical protein
MMECKIDVLVVVVVVMMNDDDDDDLCLLGCDFV